MNLETFYKVINPICIRIIHPSTSYILLMLFSAARFLSQRALGERLVRWDRFKQFYIWKYSGCTRIILRWSWYKLFAYQIMFVATKIWDFIGSYGLNLGFAGGF